MIPCRSKVCGKKWSFLGIVLSLLTREMVLAINWTIPYHNFRYTPAPSMQDINVNRNTNYYVGSPRINDNNDRTIDPRLVRLLGEMNSFDPKTQEIIDAQTQNEAIGHSFQASDNNFNRLENKIERARSFPCTVRFSNEPKEKEYTYFQRDHEFDGTLEKRSRFNDRERLLNNMRFLKKRSKMLDENPSINLDTDENDEEPEEPPQETPQKPCGGKGFKMVYEGCKAAKEWAVLFEKVSHRDRLLQILKKEKINAGPAVTSSRFFKRAAQKLAKRLKTSNNRIQKLIRKGNKSDNEGEMAQ